MAQLRATTAAMTKTLVESVRVKVSPPPPLVSSPESRQKFTGCVCGVQPQCSERVFAQNNAIFERSAVPSQFMYYHNNLWVNFSADVVETLRSGFLERKPIIEASIDGAKYIFDFKSMLQIDYVTENCRSISWIDENGKCSFPNGFFSEEEFTDFEFENEEGDNIRCNYIAKNNNCNPKIEIEVKIDQTSSKRKREEEPEVNSSYKAVGLDVIKHQRLEEGGATKWPNTKLLRETEIAYLLVKNHFLNRIRKIDDGLMVTSIHQCKQERHLDKARLEVFQKQIEITRAARGTSNMVYAWYGASAKVIESILVHGFGLPSKVSATDVYGIGVYLSPLQLPHLSTKLADSDDNGVKHLILCRVVLGNVEKVEAGSQQYHPSSVNFDTGSDDPTNPKWYVIWSTNANRHILPECVVSFRPSSNMQAKASSRCQVFPGKIVFED